MLRLHSVRVLELEVGTVSCAGETRIALSSIFTVDVYFNSLHGNIYKYIESRVNVEFMFQILSVIYIFHHIIEQKKQTKTKTFVILCWYPNFIFAV